MISLIRMRRCSLIDFSVASSQFLARNLLLIPALVMYVAVYIKITYCPSSAWSAFSRNNTGVMSRVNEPGSRSFNSSSSRIVLSCAGVMSMNRVSYVARGCWSNRVLLTGFSVFEWIWLRVILVERVKACFPGGNRTRGPVIGHSIRHLLIDGTKLQRRRELLLQLDACKYCRYLWCSYLITTNCRLRRPTTFRQFHPVQCSLRLACRACGPFSLDDVASVVE